MELTPEHKERLKRVAIAAAALVAAEMLVHYIRSKDENRAEAYVILDQASNGIAIGLLNSNNNQHPQFKGEISQTNGEHPNFDLTMIDLEEPDIDAMEEIFLGPKDT